MHAILSAHHFTHKHIDLMANENFARQDYSSSLYGYHPYQIFFLQCYRLFFHFCKSDSILTLCYQIALNYIQNLEELKLHPITKLRHVYDDQLRISWHRRRIPPPLADIFCGANLKTVVQFFVYHPVFSKEEHQRTAGYYTFCINLGFIKLYFGPRKNVTRVQRHGQRCWMEFQKETILIFPPSFLALTVHSTKIYIGYKA